MSVYYSNRQEILFDRLKENLVADRSLFSKRVLITPSLAIEKWIRLRLAEELSVATGIETLSLDQALVRFGNLSIPSEIALFCRIEKILNTELSAHPQLASYLNGCDKRLAPLCQHLVRLFRSYWLYGKKRNPGSGEWQEILWDKCHSLFPSLPHVFHTEQTGSIHLFSFTHLSPFHFTFFERLGKKTPLFFYHLSPCQEFWSEMGKEEEFAEGGHPLLGAWGKLGRGFAAWVEEKAIPTEEAYELPMERNALSSIQRSMLTLEQEEICDDPSIEIHIHATAHREIEGLHDRIVKWIDERGIKPSEINVMAPDLSRYLPFIETHFGKTIGYRIDEVKKREGAHTLLLLLFELEKNRWKAPAVLEVLTHPLLLKKLRWKENACQQMEKWVEESGIRWGYDSQHLSRLLFSASISDGRATWKEGCNALLAGLATGKTPLTEAEFLGEWVSFIHALYAALETFYDGKKRKWAEWNTCIKNLLERVTEEAEIQSLFSLFEEAGRVDPEREVCFSLVYPLLVDEAQKERESIHPHHLEAVCFSSLLPSRFTPAKAVVLLGIDHSSFPRQERASSLDLLKKEKNPYIPSKGDFDRSLFLEGLLSAREVFLVSTVSKNPQDGTLLPLSSPLATLTPFLNEKNIIVHPDLPISALTAEKTEAPPFIQVVKPEPFQCPNGSYVIDIQEFEQALRRPLHPYFKNRLGLFLREEKEVKEEEEFALSSLQLAKMRREGLKSSLEHVFDAFEQERKRPLGTFHALAEKRVCHEVETLRTTLNEFSLKKEEIETLRFSFDASSLPPLRLVSDGYQIDFVGRIDGVVPQGLFLFEKEGWEGALRHLPSFLLLHLHRPCDTLYFGRSGKKKERFFDTPKPLLERLVGYYFFMQNHPSFLFPHWIASLLSGDEKGLSKAMEEECYDREYAFAFRKEMPKPEEVIAKWQETASHLYQGVKDGWF